MNRISRYLIISFVLAFGLQGLSIFLHQPAWLKVTMWVPAVALGFCDRSLLWTQLRSLSLAKLRYIPVALFIGWLWTAIYLALLVIAGQSKWNEKFQLTADHSSIQAIHGFGMFLGFGPQSFPYFILNLLLTISVSSLLFGLIGGLGEELGWRGFLQPELEKKNGVVKATLMVGIIWGLWHLPANLAGMNSSEYPILNAFITFPLFTIALSIVFRWLQVKTNSAYFAAFAHGANNCLAAGFVIQAKTPNADLMADIGTSLLLILGAFIYYKLSRITRPQTLQ